MTLPVVHRRWSEIAPEQINPSISRRFVTGDHVTLARFELRQGGIVPRHAHPNEQVSFVVTGKLKFRIDEKEVVVAGGEILQIPGGVPHEVEVIEDALVIDVFSPIRQDWIDGTDSYFKRS